jgi:hypothetical protein
MRIHYKHLASFHGQLARERRDLVGNACTEDDELDSVFSIGDRLNRLFSLDYDGSEGAAQAILSDIDQNLSPTTPNTISPVFFSPIFGLFTESTDPGMACLFARLIVFILSSSDDLSCFREFNLLNTVKAALTTLEIPSLTIPLLQMVHVHFVCSDPSVVSEWTNSFPIQFFGDLLPNLPQVAGNADVSPHRLLQHWLLCVFSLIQSPYSMAESSLVLGLLSSILDDLQLDLQCCTNTLHILRHLLLGHTVDISQFNGLNFPAFLLAMSYHSECDIVQSALGVFEPLIEFYGSVMPIEIDLFFTIAGEHMDTPDVYKHALRCASLFVKATPALANELARGKAEEIASWAATAGFEARREIALFLCDYAVAACESGIFDALSPEVLEVICELLNVEEVAMHCLIALGTYLACVQEAIGFQEALNRLGPLDAAAQLQESLELLAQSDDEKTATTAQLLLSLREAPESEPG